MRRCHAPLVLKSFQQASNRCCWPCLIGAYELQAGPKACWELLTAVNALQLPHALQRQQGFLQVSL